MNAQNKTIVVAGGARTPIGHISRSLAGLKPEELLVDAIEATLSRAKLPKDAVDGLIAGWVGQSFTAPNIARVAALRAGLPEKTQAVTVQNNCVSSIEAVSSACRFILAGEGDLYLAGGVEVMSRLPYSIDGSRAAKPLRSMAVVKEKWGELLASSDVTVVDAMEAGLTDPVKNINMAGTAEVCAQIYGVGRAEQDEYARESFRRSLAGWKSGFYATHVLPVTRAGATVLEKDEYPHLREDLVEKPQMFAKAPALFDNSAYSMKDFFRDYGAHMPGKSFVEGQTKGSVTLFNSCGRSDGAAVVVVTTAEKAKALGLEVLAEIKGWGFMGNDPAHMGVSPALAAPVALQRAGVKFDELDNIELHEPFAATVLSIFKLGKDKFGHDWAAKNASGALNPNGGSIAVGHPLGATGARLMLNLVHALRANPKGRLGMLAACAGGGMGGALVVEKR
ncbi:MAG: thiolase family protein [Elusimicrobiota bacterium]|nr:thiolase family protein [Elusimicrobiota bacterium]